MPKPNTVANGQSAKTQPSQDSQHTHHRNRRSEPNPLGGNFILMPSLLEYLSPDLTLPEQYFYRQRNDDGMNAERALMYAVLKDGIRCFYKHVGATRRKYRKMSAEAEEWLMADDWDYPFSFRVICDTLGIDGHCLRQRLVAWKDMELERRRLTGDTKSIQVGRSPFPTPIGEIEGDLVEALAADAVASDTDRAVATAGAASDTSGAQSRGTDAQHDASSAGPDTSHRNDDDGEEEFDDYDQAARAGKFTTFDDTVHGGGFAGPGGAIGGDDDGSCGYDDFEHVSLEAYQELEEVA